MVILQPVTMRYWLPYKTKQFFFVLIKLSIVVGAIYFIYNKLVNNPNLSFSNFIGFMSENGIFSLKNSIFLLVLSIFNWFFEILKWQNLIAPIKKISIKSALEQSLGALTGSLFTPNRIGEYGAKAVYYPSNFRKHIMLVNFLGNMLQMGVTTILGLVGLSFFISIYDVTVDYHRLARLLILTIALFFLIGFGLLKSKFTIKGFSMDKIKFFIGGYPKGKLGFGFLLALLRYLVFSFQFFFLLQCFKVEISYPKAMVLITSMYLLVSFIPSVFIFDVLIKGSVAIYLFSFIGVSELSILSIIMLMWLLNVAVPSIFGSYYVLNFNLPKND